MTPTFSDFFKSFYYLNTYVPAVDLSDQKLSKHLLEKENPEAAAIAERLISEAEVQQVLSEPLTYDPIEINLRNATLERHKFKLLSSKPDLQTGQRIPFYSVVKHAALKGWIIKSGATRIPKEQLLHGPNNDRNEMAFFTDEDSLLRIEMANRIQKIAQKANIDAVLPKKKLVRYANLEEATDSNRKYCVVCEKLDLLSVEDTVQAIRNMDAEPQKEIARKIATIVKNAGIADASFDNIRLRDGKPVFIDTEPAGLMVAKKPGLRYKFFHPKGASVEKCARIGLFTLMTQAKQYGLESFHEQVKNDYEKAVTPKLSKWKITLSILSLGLIPLVNIIVALVKTKITKQTFEQIQIMNTQHAERAQKYIGEKVPEVYSPIVFTEKQQEIHLKIQAATQLLQKEDFFMEYQKKRMPLAKQFLAYTEGVLYKKNQAI